MKISKKIFAILLAVIFALSVFAVAASAAGGTAQGDEWMTVTITTDKGTETCETKETVEVTVSIACNYNVPTFRFPILYDKSVLQTKTLLGQAALNTCASAGTLSYNKVAVDPETGINPALPEGYDPDQWGVILFQWVASTTGSVGCINNPDGEAAFKFNLETTKDSAGLTGSILIPSESDMFYYMAIEDPTVATSFYYLTPDTCTMSFVPANVTVKGADVALIPNASYASDAVIDETNLMVWGLGTGMTSTADVKEYVAATGGATVSVDPTENGYGTGSKINVVLGGNVVKSYTAVVFGDFTGDSMIDSFDATSALSIIGGSVVADDITLLAGDISGADATIDSFDVTVLLSAVGGSVIINQADPYAD